MANKSLFKGRKGRKVAPANTTNKAGGAAYKLPSDAALAQMAATCTFAQTYYTSAEEQLDVMLKLAKQVNPEFVAKTAIFARERGFMKDAPALLTAVLAAGGDEGLRLFKKIFHRVIDNGRMLRTFCQILRSGVTGRKSFGTAIKREIQKWLDSKSAHYIFRASVGNDPSMADIIKMVHPKAEGEKEALYGYLIGKHVGITKLPPLVAQFEEFKGMKSGEYKGIVQVPEVPFQMLDSLGLTTEEWKQVFVTGGWHFTRMNINTAARHGVLNDDVMISLIAKKLRDPEQVRKSRVFPYQLLMASIASDAPARIKKALNDAMEIATENTPELPAGVAVCVDTSGSMGMSITGDRDYGHTGFGPSASSSMRCVDVAGLIAAVMVRKNPDTCVVPFDTRVHMVKFDPSDTIMTNAKKFSRNGGGTNCACAIKYLNDHKVKVPVVVMVSDYEAWAERGYMPYSRGTGMAQEWATYKSRVPNAKLIAINLVSGVHTQVQNSDDVYNIGGFSDQIFTLIADWVSGYDADHWVQTIMKIDL